MNTLWRAALVGGVLVALTQLGASEKLDLSRVTPVPAGQEIPIADFFRVPLWSRARLSPSGTLVAGLVNNGDDQFGLVVYDIATKHVEGVGAGTGEDKDIYSYTWLDDRRLMFFVSTQKLYGLGLMAADVANLRSPFPLLQYCGASLVSVPVTDRLHPLVWMSYLSLEEGGQRDGGVAVLETGIKTGHFIDLTTARAQHGNLVDARDNNRIHVLKTYPIPNDGLGTGYLADREGRLAFAFTSNNGVLAMHRLTDKNEWIKCPIDLETTDVFWSGDEADQVIAGVPGEPGTPRVLRVLKASTGEAGPVLIDDKGYDFVGGLYLDRSSNRVVGAFMQRDGPHSVWFDENYRGVQQMLDEFFKGKVVHIISNNEARTLFLIETYTDREPPVFSWVNVQDRTAGLIKNSRPWIDPQRMRPMQIMKFKTRDGHRLDAYVTLPAGASRANPVPLVVLPHGGPWVRDTWGFDGEVQFLASRGYAVLQPNYRGSPGYDWMFPEEQRWDFHKMHEDVTDATQAVLATGLIDRGRVAIMGGSFGAYLALSGVVNEPALYRCAVTIAGVFDWATVIKARKFDRYDDPSYSRLLRKLGDPKKEADKFDAISPVRHIDRVQVPVFVAHGKDDPVAEVTESRRLVSELEKHHVPHEVMFAGGEGHGMAHVKHQVELYARIEAFLAKNLAPLPAPAAALH
ncbi:MAG TPA: alpha/beta fold hydrolase [Opitutus sp.]|nr:alpha/beta fold hydrolase [Opitutus sp.]